MFFNGQAARLPPMHLSHHSRTLRTSKAPLKQCELREKVNLWRFYCSEVKLVFFNDVQCT